MPHPTLPDTVSLPLPGGVPLALRRIPAGSFRMGQRGGLGAGRLEYVWLNGGGSAPEKMSRIPAPSAVGWLLVFCVVLAGPATSRAHQTLAEAVEVNLHDPATIRVEFTIHAPELPTPLASGIDPSAVDPAWMAARNDAEIAQLQKETIDFIRETFHAGIDESNFLAMAAIEFDSHEAIRHPPADTKLPPGCLLATVRIANPGPPRKLRVAFGKGAQKRLLLSISRPASFPEVRDLGPGDSYDITLPEPPPNPPRGQLLPIAVVIALGLAAALVWKLRRRHPQPP